MDSNNKNRLVTIDALRGIAALSVVFFHLSGNLKNEFEQYFPALLRLMELGYLGVPVFFVISGFVISISIQESKIDINYIGKFIVRRSIRLDPVYWFSILLGLSLLYAKSAYVDSNVVFPGIDDVILHIFYLQDFFSLGQPINNVYWTLCLVV